MAEWLHYELIKINHDWIVQQREEHSGLKAVYLVSQKALELEIRSSFNSNHKEGMEQGRQKPNDDFFQRL